MSSKKFYIAYAVVAGLLFVIISLYLNSLEQRKASLILNDEVQFDRDFSPVIYDALKRIADTMPEPKPGEWLYEMEEKGQTYEEFKKGMWPRPDSKYKKIYLQPLGEFSGTNSPDVKLLQKFAESYFMMPVTVLQSIDIDTLKITSRINKYTHNKQLLTTDILHNLEMRFPSDAFCLAAVALHDLYPEPSWNFVFGQASLINRVGVFSFARYDPAFSGKQHNFTLPELNKLILKRSCKVLAHEIGHMFGFYHCISYKCGMNGSNNLMESDSKPIHLCVVCLKKLHYSIGFSIKERYERLRTFYRSVGFKDEAAEIDRRLQAMNDTTSDNFSTR